MFLGISTLNPELQVMKHMQKITQSFHELGWSSEWRQVRNLKEFETVFHRSNNKWVYILAHSELNEGIILLDQTVLDHHKLSEILQVKRSCPEVMLLNTCHGVSDNLW